MIAPKRPKSSGIVIVSDFKKGAEAIRDVVLAPMLEPLFNTFDPTVNGALRLTAQHLIDNPDLIAPSPWKTSILEIMRQFCADHPRRELDNPAIASAVDQLLLFSMIANQNRKPTAQELARVRHEVAEALGMDVRTVKKAHQRHGKHTAL